MSESPAPKMLPYTRTEHTIKRSVNTGMTNCVYSDNHRVNVELRRRWNEKI